MMRISENLRMIREERGIGVRELARRADVAPSVIWTCEAGKHIPHLHNVEKIARALHVEPYELLGWKMSSWD